MRPNPHRGRVYRRCACRGANGKQLGTRCPKLTNARHGSWAYAVDLPTLDRRKTMRRSGFVIKAEASAALGHVLECERAGVSIDDTETVADYLRRWFEAKAPTRKPNTVNRYRAYLDNDLIPAFGAIRLGSQAWIALSSRAVDALKRQRRRQRAQQLAATHYDDLDLVFPRGDGQPMRPQYLLNHFRRTTADAGVPDLRVHDLRHVAATVMLSNGVPMAVVSKTLRHKNVATTIDLYGHLTPDAAEDGVTAAAAALDRADAQAA
jgi:hypothetical protein